MHYLDALNEGDYQHYELCTLVTTTNDTSSRALSSMGSHMPRVFLFVSKYTGRKHESIHLRFDISQYI